MKRLICLFLMTCIVFMSLPINLVTAYETSEYQSWVSELNTLMSQCMELGISVDYEKLNATVIENFAEFIAADKTQGVESTQVSYNETKLYNLYTEAKGNLVGYLSGTKQPLPTPARYQTGDFNIDGTSLVKDDGTPFYSVGVGHFSKARNDIPILNHYGLSNIQNEIGPSYMIREAKGISHWETGVSSGCLATSAVDTTNYKTGTHSLKIVNKSTYSPNVYFNMRQTVTVKPNTTYTFGFYAKGNNVNKVNVSANGFNNRHDLTGISSSWTEFKFEYTTNSSAIQQTLMFISEGISDELYIDDIYMRENGTTDNIIQNGGFENGNPDFDVTLTGADTMVSTLATAEKNNVGVSLLISPHYFPGFMYNLYPDLAGSYGGVNYNINHAKAKEVIEAYLRALLPLVKNYKSLTNICLSNEPKFYTTANTTFYTPLFQAYLQQVHGTIATLNSRYGTNYSSFSEILMPSSTYSQTAAFYDWTQFNNKIFADWHRWMVGIIKEIAPNIPVHAKMMCYIHNTEDVNTKGFLSYGTDADLFADFSDMAGNDAWAYYDYPTDFVNKMKWYDFISSVYEKPIYNSEDHIIRDRNMAYTDAQATHVAADTWQGAMHGRNLSSAWIWERSYDASSDFYGSILSRPDCVAEFGKAALRLGSFSQEMTELNNTSKKVAIFYSDTARIYNERYLQLLDIAYRGTIFAGERAGFVTEKSAAEKLSCYDTLIIPGVTHLKSDALNAIKAFQNQGGNVILMKDYGNSWVFSSESSLKYNEYGKQHLTDYVSEIKSSCVSLSYSTHSSINQATVSAIQNAILNRNLSNVRLKKSSSVVSNVEWRSATMPNGDIVINACNYGSSAISGISIDIDGSATNLTATDMFTNTVLGSSFSLNPFESKLICLSNDIIGMKAETFKASNGMSLPYRIYVPSSYPSGIDDRRYRLLIYLHSEDEKGNDNLAQVTNKEALLARIIGAYGDRFIIIAPQCPAGMKWADVPLEDGSYDLYGTPKNSVMTAVEELLDTVLQDYSKVESRIFAAGVAMGGDGVWNLAMNNPGMFAGIVPVSGCGDYSKMPLIKGLNIWSFCGSNDSKVEIVRQMMQASCSSEANRKYTEYSDVSECYDQAFEEGELVNWLAGVNKTDGNYHKINSIGIRNVIVDYSSGKLNFTWDFVGDSWNGANIYSINNIGETQLITTAAGNYCPVEITDLTTPMTFVIKATDNECNESVSAFITYPVQADMVNVSRDNQMITLKNNMGYPVAGVFGVKCKNSLGELIYMNTVSKVLLPDETDTFKCNIPINSNLVLIAWDGMKTKNSID